MLRGAKGVKGGLLMAANVAYGSKGDMAALKCDFRYAPTSGLNSDIGPCQKHAPSKESC